jgi:hypothetical protein
MRLVCTGPSEAKGDEVVADLLEEGSGGAGANPRGSNADDLMNGIQPVCPHAHTCRALFGACNHDLTCSCPRRLWARGLRHGGR